MDQHSFLFQSMVYLGAAVLFVPLAKKLGLGSVLGYLLAGVVIGPAVMGLIGEEGKDIMHFAEFGVVMMLFLIGLELEPALLWKLRASILGLGGLQVTISTLIIGALAMSVGLEWKPALALGMILSLSSTAIVLQTLNEKGLMRSVAGQNAFSVLLFQDIAVIPMLALLPLLATFNRVEEAGSHQGGLWIEGWSGWQRTLIVLGSVVAIYVGGRYLISPIFRIVAATRLRELLTATSLLLIVGITVLMTQVGLSPALGAFLGGVVLANSEYRHELESDIEPFKGLLLGLFFVAVGASIDFRLMIEHPWTILGLVLMLMTVKGMVLLILGKVFRMRVDQNMLFAIALCQVGEFAFVLFSFTQTEGILEPEVINMMVAVVAISMAITPLLLLINDKLIQPWLGTKMTTVNNREADPISERNPVIIAGFGQFGNIVGRFLRAHSIGITILDIDSDRVDVLRRMGIKVYYGDASRSDLLKSAGAEQAKLIIIAIDSPEKRLEMIETIKKHFPNLRMLVRSKDRFDAYDLMNAGMLHVYRETVDTSLRMGIDALKMLGHRSYTSQRAARTFFRHDEQNLKKLSSIRDKNQYINSAKEYIEELEQIIRAEKANKNLQRDEGWEEDTLIEDVRTNDFIKSAEEKQS